MYVITRIFNIMKVAVALLLWFTVMLWECYHCCNGIVLNALWIDGQLQAYFPILLNSSHVIVMLNPYPTAGILEKNGKGSKRIAESEYNWHAKNPSCQMTCGSVNLDPRRPCPLLSTPSIDQTLHQFANLLPNWTLLPILTLLPNFGGIHRTLQRVRLANRGRLLLRTPGPVHLGLTFVLMLRPFFPELVMSTDLLSFDHPSVLLFCISLIHVWC